MKTQASMKLILNLLSLILFTSPLSSARKQSLCHNNERSALIHFKVSFSIFKLASSDPFAYPKTELWNPIGNGSNCCLWDGVTCDEETGHVIGLDLSSSYLHGSINSNSTIFDLVHLQTLNLADNDFGYSLIPTKIGCLSNLKHLNLSRAAFFGQVPIAISNLSKLLSLDLSDNQDPLSGANILRLGNPGLKTLIQNSTPLEIKLNHVIVSSRVPKFLENLTSLRYIGLEDCKLHGVFLEGIFLLPNLQVLNVASNEDLVGYLPKFHNSSKLEHLILPSTRFSGNIPTSIGNLRSLTALDFSLCSFWGSIPYLVGQLTKLTVLNLAANNFKGRIPKSLANLTQLYWLGLAKNNLVGEVPSFFANLTKLQFLELSFDGLWGPFPSFIFGLESLEFINLEGNNFSGSVEFDLFLKPKHLKFLQLSEVDLILPTTTHHNDSFPQFLGLTLVECNLTQFPYFLHNQTKLQLLGLSYNQIEGPLLVPSSSLLYYDLSYNALSGEISTSICNSSSFSFIDLKDNNLSGRIPQCLVNLSNSMAMLSLNQNNLRGSIPNSFSTGCTLKMINLGNNQLQGRLPRSLAYCSSLEVLDLGNNLITDTIPSWLGALTKLQALALGSNRLHGTLPIEFGLGFPKLRIVDLSNNKLTGSLSNQLFHNWHAMGAQHQSQSSYMVSTTVTTTYGFIMIIQLPYYITIRYKGRETFNEHILSIFNSLDLSNNEFVGKIPESMGNLMSLEALNLSHNNLTGSIPQSFRKLSNLESLDLSCNLLSGEIPQQLTNLTFLEIFNVSYNYLRGAIPQGNQFSTFGNDSFEGNTGLCGNPLSNKCGDSNVQSPSQPHPSSYDGDNEESSTLVNWIIISMGYLSGLVVGVIIGHIITCRYHEWFVETFRRRGQHSKRRGRRGQHNKRRARR
ncbi:hypothetical protein Ancab_039648 [Ancistrocladus abbreviatus]